MATELLTSTDFYFLNQNFEAVHKLTQFESLMWVDKYDEPGSFEIYAPPLPEIKEAAQVNNYFKTSRSDKMMIVEELETTVSPENGKRLVIRGRSLESILDRRVIFLKCYFRDEIDDPDPDEGQYGSNNLEDAIRQLLDYCFIHPIDTEREMNLVFQYSDSPEALMDSNHRNITDEFGNPILCDSTETEPINSIHLKDCEFEKGENCLNIVMAIVKQAGLGFQITVNENKQFVFKLTKGKNRTTEQLENPAVVFSPTFNNIKNTKFTEKYGETYKNFVYTEGETYKSRKPTIVKTGDAEGLLRREVYVESSVVHETEASNVTHEGITKNKKTLSEDEYQEALTKDANKYFEKYSGKTTCESEVEPRLTFQYGRDFGIGDVLEIQDGTGNTGKVRCVEFIISYSASGYEEYPTFKNFGDDDDTPSQSTTSGGQYTDGENKGGGGGGSEYDIKFNQTLDKLILTEDSSDKTSVPVIATYNGTMADWNNLSAAEQAKYRHIIFTDETGSDDISGKAITYTSSDTTDANATSWTSVSKLTSGLSLTTLFARMSEMFKNIRYLYNTASPVGMINAFGGTTAPDGWLLCQGQAISRTTYADLFAVIGTNFGSGDGSTTFNIPDLRGEFLRGAGTNSHANQGNGGNVGTHQDATSHVNITTYAVSNDQWLGLANGQNGVANADKANSAVTRYIYGQSVTKYTNSTMSTHYTSRPTNTSVNFIIKAKR